MDNSMFLLLAAVGGLVIAGLSFYAGRLLFLLRKQKLREEAFLAEYNDKLEKKNAHTLDSIRFIAKAIIEDQCELSEGAIRICTLLDNYTGQEDAYKTDYPAFYSLFNKIKDFPTHQAYKDQEKKARMQQNMQRWQFEAELKEPMLAEAKLLMDFKK